MPLNSKEAVPSYPGQVFNWSVSAKDILDYTVWYSYLLCCVVKGVPEYKTYSKYHIAYSLQKFHSVSCRLGHFHPGTDHSHLDRNVYLEGG